MNEVRRNSHCQHTSRVGRADLTVVWIAITRITIWAMTTKNASGAGSTSIAKGPVATGWSWQAEPLRHAASTSQAGGGAVRHEDVAGGGRRQPGLEEARLGYRQGMNPWPRSRSLIGLILKTTSAIKAFKGAGNTFIKLPAVAINACIEIGLAETIGQCNCAQLTVGIRRALERTLSIPKIRLVAFARARLAISIFFRSVSVKCSDSKVAWFANTITSCPSLIRGGGIVGAQDRLPISSTIGALWARCARAHVVIIEPFLAFAILARVRARLHCGSLRPTSATNGIGNIGLVFTFEACSAKVVGRIVSIARTALAVSRTLDWKTWRY